MSRNSSGTYTLPVGNPVVSGTVIEANWANTTNDDIAAALTDSLSRSGKGSMSASLRIIDGSASVPGVAFANETGSGAYRAAAGDWYLTVLGNNIARLRASGVDVTGALGVSGTMTSAGISDSGNLTFTGTGNRITGDFSNATVANRVVFQTSTANDNTLITAIPNGTSQFSGFYALNGTSANVSRASFAISGTDVRFVSGIEGTGSYLPMAFYTGGSERMRIDTSGKVGINTASPYCKLDVYGNTAQEVTSLFTTGVDDLNFRVGFANGVAGSTGALQGQIGLFYLGTGEAATVGFVRGGSATDASLTIRTNGSERMRVDSYGNMGLGTSSMTIGAAGQTDLEIKGSTGRGNVYLNTAAADAASVICGSFGFIGGASTSSASEKRTSLISGYTEGATANARGGYLTFSTKPNGASASMTERMRISSAGQVFSNCTASPTSNGLGTGGFGILATGGDAINLKHTSDGSTTFNLWQTGTTNFGAIQFYKGNSQTAVGNISCSTSATFYNTSSDYRLKENIQPMQNALAVVQQLNPVTYTWKADGSDGQGFIAHELQSVVPDCVTGEKDAVRTVDVFDEDGEKIGTKEEPVYQGIDASFLVATLTKAIQELNAKIEGQQAEIDALKAAAK